MTYRELQTPPTWVWVTFKEIAEVASDLVDPTLTPHAIHIAPNHIESKTGKLLPYETVEKDGVTSPKHRFRRGQILYSKIRPYLTKAIVAPFDGVCSADMYPIDRKIDSRFLHYWILTPWFTNESATHQGRSVLPKINQEALNKLSIPVPPIEEQRRIVASIEVNFSRLEVGSANLVKVRSKLKRYRASVLKAACEGRLVPTEAELAHSEGRDYEPASLLLDRILTEQRLKWEREQLAKIAINKEPPKNWRERYIEPTPPKMAGLSKPPEGWCWASVQQVGAVQLGRQRSPRHHNGSHMRPYLRVANVFEDRIDIIDVMQMNYSPDEFKIYELSYGDILLNEGQSMELIGRPAMYRNEVPGACFTNTLVRFQAFKGLLPEFALKVFLSYLKNGRFQKIATITVNLAHLGAKRFSEIEFPVPPMAEQQRIVAEVERCLSLIDALEAAVSANLKRSERLRQSILKRAFEGKLVPQDPNDEPASKLLERIKANRTEGPIKRLESKRKSVHHKSEEIPLTQERLFPDESPPTPRRRRV